MRRLARPMVHSAGRRSRRLREVRSMFGLRTCPGQQRLRMAPEGVLIDWVELRG